MGNYQRTVKRVSATAEDVYRVLLASLTKLKLLFMTLFMFSGGHFNILEVESSSIRRLYDSMFLSTGIVQPQGLAYRDG